MKRYAANGITVCRMIASAFLLICPTGSATFLITYLVCGLSDMADGAIARRTGSVSALGGRLDTAADFLFTAATMAKLLPLLPIPLWLWIWIAAVAGIKIANVAVGLIRQKSWSRCIPFIIESRDCACSFFHCRCVLSNGNSALCCCVPSRPCPPFMRGMLQTVSRVTRGEAKPTHISGKMKPHTKMLCGLRVSGK